MLRFFLPLLLAAVPIALAAEPDGFSPDSLPQPGVPRGELRQMPAWESSQIFPGTRHEWSIYFPANHDSAKPACAMVFLDGSGFAKADGQWRVPTVFDNLIAKGDMPPAVGIFINPGVVPAAVPGGKDRANRSFEYDSPGDACARFLLEEIIPEVRKVCALSDDPKDWAVCGISSSAIAAFTAAWERPDRFGKVVSHIGSFTNIRGGFAYPALIRKTKAQPKPIRVYLQEGESDLDNLHGHWPLANRDMAAALQFAGYDHKFEMTAGGHSGKAGGLRLPETLRWVWRDWRNE